MKEFEKELLKAIKSYSGSGCGVTKSIEVLRQNKSLAELKHYKAVFFYLNCYSCQHELESAFTDIDFFDFSTKRNWKQLELPLFSEEEFFDQFQGGD